MVRRVYIETFGCQMNEVDSARMVALLGKENYRPAESLSDADLVLLNTCSIREKADQKIYSALGHLRRWKEGREGRLVAVGGCLAQQEGPKMRKRAPHVDIVFGTHSISRLPGLLRSPKMAQGAVDLLVRLLPDAAGVQKHEIGIGQGFRRAVIFLPEERHHPGRVHLVHLAAECLDVYAPDHDFPF